jgi:hypothetical protein
MPSAIQRPFRTLARQEWDAVLVAAFSPSIFHIDNTSISYLLV